MDKETLIGLGLEDALAEAVVAELEKQQMIPKSRFDAVNEAKKALEAQIADYDGQLAALKTANEGNEDLQKQIADLQQAQADAKAKYDAELAESKLLSAIKLDLIQGGDVHDVDLLISLMDKSLVKLDESGKITSGLQEQKTAFKESKPFLFNVSQQQEPIKPTITGAAPAQSANVTGSLSEVSLGAQMAAKANSSTNNNSTLWV